MRAVFFTLLFAFSLQAYEFVLLNKTDIDDSDIIDAITSQIDNYYESDESSIEFNSIEDKDAVLKVLQEYDYSGDEEEKKILLAKYQILEDDLKTIFSTKYILMVDEHINEEGRNELRITLKVDNVNYFDTTYIMPQLDDKEEVYADTITNVVLTYLLYKDKNFIKVHQL